MSWQSGIQSLVSLYFNCGSKEGYWHIATTLKVRRDKYLLRVRQLNDEWCPVTITVTSNKHLDVVHPRDHVFGIIYCGIMYDNLSVKDISRDGLIDISPRSTLLPMFSYIRAHSNIRARLHASPSIRCKRGYYHNSTVTLYLIIITMYLVN